MKIKTRDIRERGLFTTAQAAEYLGVSAWTVNQLKRRGTLKPYNVDGRSVYDEKELQALRDQHIAPPGLISADEICKVYGKGRSIVEYHLEAYDIKPAAPRGPGRLVRQFDPVVVDQMANDLGWEKVVAENHSDES